ncbi:MAG: tail fiber domain-containing protein [Limisphaerales bacterium]
MKNKMKTNILFLSFALLLAVSGRAQTTAFTYQGTLNDNGVPASGNYDLQFSLRDALAAGNPIGSPVTTAPVAVSNGLFTVTLDFGSGSFNGNSRWLEIGVRTNGSAGAYMLLAPRQAITSTPYAIQAANASSASTVTGSISDAQLSSNIPRLNTAANFTGATTFNPAVGAPFAVGNSTKVINLNADWLDGLDSTAFWKTAGNSGTTPAINFIGTTDNQALEFRVNGSRALRLEPTGVSPNVIGGFSGNFVASGKYGSTISGGGSSGFTNSIFAYFSTIGGGYENTIQTNAHSSTIGGGYYNTIQTNASYSTIGGGSFNIIQATAHYSTISGGLFNTIQNNASYSTIGGGSFNSIQPNAYYPTISGGYNNIITPNANFAMIPGGYLNVADGTGSFAAGYRAKANHTGAFVWADYSLFDFPSLANNSFSVRSLGGARFVTAIDELGNPTAGVSVDPGGTSWSTLSDRNAKKNFQPLDKKEVLEKLAAMPVDYWNYKWESDKDVPHIGPVAQDFKAAFYPGRDDKSITTLEFDGVALAAIQGLNEKLQDQARGKDDAIQTLQTENRSLEKRLNELEQLVKALAEKN